MNNVLMKCGHTANAEYEDGKPCCLICAPKIEAFEIVEEKPDLKRRKAKCDYCGKVTGSRWDLPFFEYRPNKEFDHYYCGCWGWS